MAQIAAMEAKFGSGHADIDGGPPADDSGATGLGNLFDDDNLSGFSDEGTWSHVRGVDCVLGHLVTCTWWLVC